MSETIRRRRLTQEYETVEIPDGHVVCPSCRGKGNRTPYERGRRTVLPSLRLSVPEPCGLCRKRGYVLERKL